ncbi:hypothetical protein [Nocardioides sp. SYSU DS0651]|uniref:hypothetical protein n=1 Tax=Nocardioides sp. SYSU DS0651 TaxID=3415955 RepID=UPI003F4B152D
MRSRVGVVAVVSALLAGLVTGCSSADGDPPPSASSTPASEATSSGSPSGPGSSTTPVDDVAPATGDLVTMRTAGTFRLPAGVDASVSQAGSAAVALIHVDEGVVRIGAAEFAIPGATVEKVAEVALDSFAAQHPGLERLPNREVGGLDGYALQATNDGTTYYQYGTVSGELRVYFEFRYPETFAEGEEWVDSVLASVEWA